MGKVCSEGDVIAVPLGAGHHALGVVTRRYGRTMFLGEFFAPRRAGALPRSQSFALRQDEAVYRPVTSTYGLSEKRWTVVGRVEGFSHELWPQTSFRRWDELARRWILVRFPDGNLRAPIEESWATENEVEGLRTTVRPVTSS